MEYQAMTLAQIREKGMEVLRQQLGVVGMVRFLQQVKLGWGNYTEERHQWLKVAQKIQETPSKP